MTDPADDELLKKLGLALTAATTQTLLVTNELESEYLEEMKEVVRERPDDSTEFLFSIIVSFLASAANAGYSAEQLVSNFGTSMAGVMENLDDLESGGDDP